MAIGETLLKVTDYPFAYSIAFILLKIDKIDAFSTEAVPYFIIAGFAASTLAILDPIGRAFKGYAMLVEWFYLRKKRETIVKSWSDVKGAFYTQSIEIEKDKIVSIIYFIIFIAIFLLVISDENFYESNFKILYENDPNCNLQCSQTNIFIILFLTGLSIAIIGGWNGGYFIKRIRIVATYLKCINSPLVLANSNDNLSNFIKLGDWKTAEFWMNQLEDEFFEEKGLAEQREQNIKNHIRALLSQLSNKKDMESERKGFAIDNIDHTLIDFPLLRPLLCHLGTDKQTKNIFTIFLNIKETTKKLDEIKNQIDKKIEKFFTQLNNDFKNMGSWVEEKKILTNKNTQENFSLRNFVKDLSNFYVVDSTGSFEIKEVQNSMFGINIPGITIMGNLRRETAEMILTKFKDFQNDVNSIQKLLSSEKEKIVPLREQVFESLQKIINEMKILGTPLNGFCETCLNENFRSKKFIDDNKNKLNSFNWKVLEYQFSYPF